MAAQSQTLKLPRQLAANCGGEKRETSRKQYYHTQPGSVVSSSSARLTLHKPNRSFQLQCIRLLLLKKKKRNVKVLLFLSALEHFFTKMP